MKQFSIYSMITMGMLTGLTGCTGGSSTSSYATDKDKYSMAMKKVGFGNREVRDHTIQFWKSR